MKTYQLNTNHLRNGLFYILYSFFMRTGFYLIFIILSRLFIDKYEFSFENVSFLLGILSIGYLLSYVIGGVLGDFILSHKVVLYLASLIMIFGALSLVSHFQGLIIPALILLALGRGINEPNVLAGLFKSYVKQPDMIDSGMMFQYLSIGLGGFMATILIANIGISHFDMILILASFFFLMGLFITSLINNDNQPEIYFNTSANFNTRFKLILSSLFVLILFTIFFFEINHQVTTLNAKFLTLFGSESVVFSVVNLMNVETELSVFLSFALAVLFMFYNLNRLKRVVYGFIFFVLSLLVISIIPVNIKEIHLLHIIISLFLLVLSDVLIVPTSYIIIGINTSYKYLTLVFSLTLLFIVSINMLVFNYLPLKFSLMSIGISAVVLIVIYGYLTGFFKISHTSTP